MAENTIINSTWFIKERADAVRARLNLGMGLWLYIGTTVPVTPSLTPAQIIEPSFSGYGRATTIGTFTPPVLIMPGQFLLSSLAFTFTSADALPQLVQGFALVDGGHVQAVGTFPEAQQVADGLPLTFAINWFIR